MSNEKKELIKKVRDLIKNEEFEKAFEVLQTNKKNDAFLNFEYYKLISNKETPVYDPESARLELNKLYKKNFILAWYERALLFFNGVDDTVKDIDKAIDDFRKVALSDINNKYAKKEIIDSRKRLALIYKEGLSEKDPEESLRMIKSACEDESDLEAYYFAAKIYLEDFKDKKDNENKAIEYLQHSAEKGHLDSKKLLSKIYLVLSKKYMNEIIDENSEDIDSRILSDKLSKIDTDLL
tara:strand:+ start:121565 stop:122278 length:714 start_codon:yes stop_codon:yes gene_type:complete